MDGVDCEWGAYLSDDTFESGQDFSANCGQSQTLFGLDLFLCHWHLSQSFPCQSAIYHQWNSPDFASVWTQYTMANQVLHRTSDTVNQQQY